MSAAVRMRTVTYRTDDGPITVEYDALAPCIACGLAVIEASMGGTRLCPWCDCGINRSGQKIAWPPREASETEYLASVASVTWGREA